MRKKIIVIVILSVIFLTLINHSLSAAERDYFVPMVKSSWQSEAKGQYQCRLSQRIPFYGTGMFEHKSGHRVIFKLLTDEAIIDNVNIIVQSEPPSWRHDDTVFEIGQFKFEHGHKPLIIPSPYASRMLQQIENGMSPVVIYRDMADQRDLISIRLSPVHFRDALKDYRQCEKTLIDFDLDEIKNLKVYFASNKAILNQDSKNKLKNIVRYLKMDKTILQVKIDAFADSRGRRRFNDDLSERRARAVENYLLSTGIKAGMMYAVSHGERAADHNNNTVSGRAHNRRVDIHLLTQKPPTIAEQEAIKVANRALRRRRLSERSIFNQQTVTKDIVKPQKKTNRLVKRDKKEKNNQSANNVPDETVIDGEPPAPNFINFDHLVDKNNQKIKSK